MFCPKCGSNQGEGKKFCTVCGTNLFVVSQALTGKLPQAPMNYAPPMITAHEIERQKDLKKGITMAVLGGGYIVYQLISFFLSFPFYGGRWPLGTMSFIAFIVFAVGLSKIIGARVTAAEPAAISDHGGVRFASTASVKPESPQPVFSNPATMESIAPRTSELDPGRRPTTSVTEDDTRHLAR